MRDALFGDTKPSFEEIAANVKTGVAITPRQKKSDKSPFTGKPMQTLIAAGIPVMVDLDNRAVYPTFD